MVDLVSIRRINDMQRVKSRLWLGWKVLLECKRFYLVLAFMLSTANQSLSGLLIR